MSISARARRPRSPPPPKVIESWVWHARAMGLSGAIALVDVEAAASWIERAKTFSKVLGIIDRGEPAPGLTYVFVGDRPPLHLIEADLAQWSSDDAAIGLAELDAALAEGEPAWRDFLAKANLVAVDEAAAVAMPRVPRYVDVLGFRPEVERTRRLPAVLAELGVNPAGAKRPGDRDVFALDRAWTLELLVLARMALRDGVRESPAVLTALARERIDGRRLLIQTAS